MENDRTWQSYEQVAQFLLDKFSKKFGLTRVEGKQKIIGTRSGTTYTIDAKGVRKEGNKAFVIVECRRYTTSRQNQERVGALAYRIIDTGAKGGIIVSPLGLQEGGEKIAQAENIIDVRLGENSTTTDYILSFLNKIFVGVTDKVQISEQVIVKKS